MSANTQKLSIKEKIGYSLGDLSANLVFQTLMMFILLFYTDVFGIPPAQAASVLFFGGIIGAFFNPVMGAIADRTNTKWGKFRPWILWTAVPFGLIAYLAFSTPDLSVSGKVIYAFVTYIMLVIIYSANNLPYAALSGVMTGDVVERTSLSSYRFVAVMVAQFCTQVLLLPLVLWLGEGDKTVGFKYTIGIFAVVSVVFFIITFLTTKERIKPIQEEKVPLAQDLKDLVQNRPWIIIFLVTTIMFVSLAMRGGIFAYYFKDFLSEAHLSSFMASLPLIGDGWRADVPTYAFSLFNGGGIVASIIGIMFSAPLASRFGKRNIFGIFMFLSAMLVIAFALYPPTAIPLVFATQFCQGLFFGVTVPLLWAMIGDVADFSEWKNNRRATGIVFSAMIVGLKVGLSIGGALNGYILAAFGYEAGLASQNPQAIEGIKLAVSLFPGLAFVITSLLLFFYQINKPMEHQIERELAQRRKPATPTANGQHKDLRNNKTIRIKDIQNA